MKSAYELAMERLAKESPVDSITKTKIAIAEDKNILQKLQREKFF